MKKTVVGAFLVLVVAVLVVGGNGNSSPITRSRLILSLSGQTTASPSSSVSPSDPATAISSTQTSSGGNVKWTLTISPSTETVPAGSNCKFSITPTGSNSLTGVRVQISSDISPKTAQTPDLRQPLYDIGINSGSIGLYSTTGKGSKGTYTITATAKGIQYPIVGQTQTASATLIVN